MPHLLRLPVELQLQISKESCPHFNLASKPDLYFLTMHLHTSPSSSSSILSSPSPSPAATRDVQPLSKTCRHLRDLIEPGLFRCVLASEDNIIEMLRLFATEPRLGRHVELFHTAPLDLQDVRTRKPVPLGNEAVDFVNELIRNIVGKSKARDKHTDLPSLEGYHHASKPNTALMMWSRNLAILDTCPYLPKFAYIQQDVWNWLEATDWNATEYRHIYEQLNLLMLKIMPNLKYVRFDGFGADIFPPLRLELALPRLKHPSLDNSISLYEVHSVAPQLKVLTAANICATSTTMSCPNLKRLHMTRADLCASYPQDLLVKCPNLNSLGRFRDMQVLRVIQV